MKPNWKALAKEAYRKGYERGRKEKTGWMPARDPPKESGKYQCTTVSIGSDGLNRSIKFLSYDKNKGWEYLLTPTGYEAVTHWMLHPEFPDLNESLACIALAAKDEKNGG